MNAHLASATACMVGISCGQILFRKAALALPAQSSWWDWVANPWLLAALALYGVTTLGWVWTLRHAPLNLAYPVMGLAFVLVPVLERLLLGEPMSMRTLAGAALITAGIAVTAARP